MLHALVFEKFNISPNYRLMLHALVFEKFKEFKKIIFFKK